MLQATTQINSQLGAMPNSSIPGNRVGSNNRHNTTEAIVAAQFNALREKACQPRIDRVFAI